MTQVAALVAEAAALPAPRGAAATPRLFRAKPAPAAHRAAGRYSVERGEATAGSKPRPSTR